MFSIFYKLIIVYCYCVVNHDNKLAHFRPLLSIIYRSIAYRYETANDLTISTTV